jgi:hypothetical protein
MSAFSRVETYMAEIVNVQATPFDMTELRRPSGNERTA